MISIEHDEQNRERRQRLAAAESQFARDPQATPDARAAEELLHELQVHQIELEMQNEELRQSRIDLEASRDRYADLYEFAPVGYLTLDANGLIAEINLTGATLLGTDRKQLRQRRFATFVGAADQDRWMEHFLTLKKYGGKAHIDLALRRGDGSMFDALVLCEAQKVGAGDTAIRVVLTDISDKVKSKQSDLNFLAVFERSPIGIGIAGPDRRYRMVNPALCRMLGYSEAELVGMSFIDVTHPDDVKLNLWNFEGLSTGEASHFAMEKRYVKKDGEVVWALLNVVAVTGESGREAYTIGLAKDITERKRMETELLATRNRLEATLGAIPDLLFEVDRDGRLHDYRAQRSDLLVAPPEVFLGKTFAEVLPPSAAETCLGALREADEKGSSVGAAYCLPLPQGETWFELSVAAMPSSGGDRRFIVLARDITERKQAEAQRLGFASQQRDTLVREVHHRIKNNLQSVAGLLQRELGQFLELDPRLEAAISQVSAIAAVHGLQSIHADEAIRLCDSVGSICKAVSDLSQRPVLFHIEHEQTAFRPVRIENSEAVSIALVLNELILNAVKHSPPGSAATSVSLSANGTSAEVMIRNARLVAHTFDFDTGAGLGTGLRLVRSLLPVEGAHLDYEQDGTGFMLTRLKLTAPVVTKQDHRP
ncbi:MAG: PAS domain S-box protein [Sulfuritalea sp.]|nr:PAS domain S-box protein [Sulfuritalea sp.]